MDLFSASGLFWEKKDQHELFKQWLRRRASFPSHAFQKSANIESFMVRASYTYFSCIFGGVLCKRNNDTAKCAGTYPQYDEVIVLLISDASEDASFCKESSCGARFCFIKYFTRKKVIRT